MTRLEQTESAGLDPEVQEQEILAELRAGERHNLGFLIDRYGAGLMSYLMAITGKMDLSEDVFQDTWVRVMEHVRGFDPSRSFSPWLFRIARNLAYDRLRLLRWKSRLGIGAADPEDSTIDVTAPGDFREGVIARDLTAALLAGLEPVLREVIWLRFFSEMSYEQIAKHCRLPLGTVKSRLARALDQLGHRYQNLRGVAHG
jgi:RNA polymerase sigma-70 factor (ECF subfamily)